MQFLNNLYQSREVAESLEYSSVITDDRGADDKQPQQSILQETEGLLHREGDESHENNTGHRKRRRPNKVELQMAFEQPTPMPTCCSVKIFYST